MSVNRPAYTIYVQVATKTVRVSPIDVLGTSGERPQKVRTHQWHDTVTESNCGVTRQSLLRG